MTTSPRTNTMSKLRVTVWETPARMSTREGPSRSCKQRPRVLCCAPRTFPHPPPSQYDSPWRPTTPGSCGCHRPACNKHIVIRHPIGSTILVSRTCSFPRISRFPRHFTKMVSSILSLMRSSGSFTLDSSAAMVPTMPGASVLRSGALRTASRTAEFLLFAKF